MGGRRGGRGSERRRAEREGRAHRSGGGRRSGKSDRRSSRREGGDRGGDGDRERRHRRGGDGDRRRDRGERRASRDERRASRDQRREQRRDGRDGREGRSGRHEGGKRDDNIDPLYGIAAAFRRWQGEQHRRSAFPADATPLTRLEFEGTFVCQPLPTACSRTHKTPFLQRVLVPRRPDAPLLPSYFASRGAFATPSPPEAPADCVAFLAWPDTSIREVLENVRRYYFSLPAEARPSWFFDPAVSAEIAAVFPGADAVASKSAIGRVMPSGLVSEIDHTPLESAWRAAEVFAGGDVSKHGGRSPAETATADRAAVARVAAAAERAPGASLAKSSQRRLRLGDVLLLTPLPPTTATRSNGNGKTH